MVIDSFSGALRFHLDELTGLDAFKLLKQQQVGNRTYEWWQLEIQTANIGIVNVYVS